MQVFARNSRAHRFALLPLVLCAGVYMNTAIALAQPADSAVSDLPPPPPPPPPPPAPTTTPSSVRIESSSTTIKFGFLAQPQYEAAGSVAQNSMSQNLYLRRARILIGGSVFSLFDYFFDTDFANLMKASTTGADPAMQMPGVTAKAVPGINIQDVFLTYKPMADLIKVDVGYLLPPLSHNALQGAGTLYGWDYFAYSFQHSGAGYGAANLFGAAGANPVGRDVGVQARGLVLDGRLEYRAGLFQGRRNNATVTQVGARNFFRFAARIQVNLFDPEAGFFYAGTYFGSKKILSFGASVDLQDNYAYFAGDGLVDLPLGPGVVTGQINLAHWNAGTIGGVATMPEAQTAFTAEAGYNVAAVQVSPIVRFEELARSGAPADETRIGVGAAYWPYQHTSNLKLFYTRVIRQNAAHGANQINLQWQLYFF